jgi:hypothetical protein
MTLQRQGRRIGSCPSDPALVAVAETGTVASVAGRLGCDDLEMLARRSTPRRRSDKEIVAQCGSYEAGGTKIRHLEGAQRRG